MKNFAAYRISALSTLAATFLLLSSCEGILNNPLKDKDTGENINLLLVDFNFFKTHITTRILDANSKELITSPVTVSYTGRNGNNIINFTGKKNSSYTSTQGQIELTTDPSVLISDQSPFDFTVRAEAEGYLPVSKTVVFLSEGKKSIDLYLVKASDQNSADLEGGIKIDGNDTTIVFGGTRNPVFKRALAGEKPFKISYSMTLSDFLKLKDSSGELLFHSSEEFYAAYNANPTGFMFIRTVTSGEYPAWIDNLRHNGEIRRVIFHILESGTLSLLEINGTAVSSFNGSTLKALCTWTGTPVPEIFGYTEFDTDCWDYRGTTVPIGGLPFSYTLAEASGETLCASGTLLQFRSAVPSSFRITADVFDLNNKLLFTLSFAGSFPASFTVENTPPVPVRLVFRNDNPAFKPIPELAVSNFCSGTYEINIEPQTSYSGYQVVLRAFCPDNPQIAIAPSYNGEYRLVDSGQPWQGASMKGGVVDLLGIPDREYEYRILWENDWEVTRFYTRFNPDGSYPYPNNSQITSDKLPDGRTRIHISHLYKQSVCDTMGW